jgi:hypothetical protein
MSTTKRTIPSNLLVSSTTKRPTFAEFLDKNNNRFGLTGAEYLEQPGKWTFKLWVKKEAILSFDVRSDEDSSYNAVITIYGPKPLGDDVPEWAMDLIIAYAEAMVSWGGSVQILVEYKYAVTDMNVQPA